jgi:hypothetical protein
MNLNFKEWFITESQNTQVLLPFIKHRIEKRLNSISNNELRSDYQEAMMKLYEIVSKEREVPVLYRRVMRHYEITKDHMQHRSRSDSDYNLAYDHTEPDNDLWLIVRAIDDISHNKSPDLESLV